MSKNTDVDVLEARIRELKSIIRSLQKKLKKASKGYRKHFIDETEEVEDKLLCPHCSKGNIKETVVLGYVFQNCSTCGPIGKK